MPIKILKDRKYWGPFWCQPNLPSIFDTSLSYYEVLCRLNALIVDLLKAIEEFDGVSQDELAAAVRALNKAIAEAEARLNNRIDHIDQEILDLFKPELDKMKAQILELAYIIGDKTDKLQQQIDNLNNSIQSLYDYVNSIENNIKAWVLIQLNDKTYCFSPFTGVWITNKRAIYELAQEERVNGLTAQEHDNMQWTAEEFDNFNWTALYYDWASIAHYKEA